MRRSAVLAIVLLCVLARQASAAPPARPENVRRDLDALQRAVEGAVARVVPPAAGFFGVAPVRAYRVQGVGILVVLPARALPSERQRPPVDPQVVRALDEAMRGLQESLQTADTAEARQQLRQSLESLRKTRVTMMRARPARPRQRSVPHFDAGEKRLAQEIEAQLLHMQAQAEAFRLAAEDARQAAERDLQEQFSALVGPGQTQAAGAVLAPPSAPRAPEPPQAPEPMFMPMPPAPWELWFSMEGEEAETRSADELVQEVKTAVTSALATHRGPWETLAPEETVAVALDFLPQRGGPAAPRTVALRVKASDLAARLKGRITREELVRRIHAAEY